MPALGLAAGVAVREVLAGLCGDAGLKWPNDVVTPRGKLAGLLVDLSGEVGGPLQAVIGVGVNLRVNETLRHLVAETGGLPPVGIEIPGGEGRWSRNALAAGLIDAIIRALMLFARDGLTPFADAWRRADVLQDAQVEVISGNSHQLGIARGISPDGALLLQVDGQLVTVLSGDVSVRTTP
jgi:BirA family biotin operon repressor/biotin-[acetyl-CoA-carboxylase] ligase